MKPVRVLTTPWQAVRLPDTRGGIAISAVAVIALGLGAASCGGSQTPSSEGTVGQSHVAGGDGADADDPNGAGEVSPDESGEGGEGAVADDAPAVTFRLANTAKEDLVFSVDKGWQPVIFAHSGKPPNAVSIVMFPKFCTASCDAAAADRCPYCPQPERVRDIKAAEKREVVAAGDSLDVPWDGQVYVYEDTKGKRDGRAVKCECFRTEPVAPATYTVKACGLRITKSATSASKYQCPDAQMTMPSDEPQVVEFEFPEP